MQMHHVRALLMGGQACVFYGAAQFHRDTDLVILAEQENFARLKRALEELQAEPIAVPPCEISFLERGFALHFRCQHPEAPLMRVDIMSKMRGVDDFARLWDRRTTIEIASGIRCDILSLPDLVQAKKTQRDKDWPMIRRLVEVHYFDFKNEASPDQIRFWLAELRTPQLLIEVARLHPHACQNWVAHRPLLSLAALGDPERLAQAMHAEEWREREQDRQYWAPLLAELKILRRVR